MMDSWSGLYNQPFRSSKRRPLTRHRCRPLTRVVELFALARDAPRRIGPAIVSFPCGCTHSTATGWWIWHAGYGWTGRHGMGGGMMGSGGMGMPGGGRFRHDDMSGFVLGGSWGEGIGQC